MSSLPVVRPAGAGRIRIKALPLALLAAALVLELLPIRPARAQAAQTFPSTPPSNTPSMALPGAGGTSPAVLDVGRYAGNAAVDRIVVEVERNAVPADGQTPVLIRVLVFDKNGQRLKQPAFVTVETTAGRILLPGARTDELGPRRKDGDKVVPGVQIKTEDGTAVFSLLAPDQAQDVKLRVSAGQHSAEGVISFVPEMREMLATGLIEGIVNFHRRGSTALQPNRSQDGFDQAIDSWARQFRDGKADVESRVAFYLKGTVRGDYLLTAAYDSDKDTQSRLLRDVNPDKFYPVYGDASQLSFDAQSASRLYVRIDKNKTYAMYGTFVLGDTMAAPVGRGVLAALKQRSLGAYTRTATGARFHTEQEGFTGDMFLFQDTLHQVVEELASQGSGPYGLSNNAVEGTEVVEVVTRDRNQPSRIIATRTLERLVDYIFEPFSGRITLTTFLPAYDSNLNPLSLRITYEVDQGGEKFWVGGASAQYRVNEHLGVGGAMATDRNPLAPYDLASVNTTVYMGPNTALVAEVAKSRSTVNTNSANQAVTPALAGDIGQVDGKAARVEFAHQDATSEVHVLAIKADNGFNNAASPVNGGQEVVDGKATYKVTQDVTAYAQVQANKDTTSLGGSRADAGAGVRVAATERLTVDVGLRAERETVGANGSGVLSNPFGSTAGLTSSIGSGSGGGALGFGNQNIDPTTGLPIITQTPLANSVSTMPAGTKLASESVHVGVGYRVNERATVGAEVEQDVAGDKRARESVGGDYQLTERSKLYGRFEHQDGWVNMSGVTANGTSANAFVLGVNSSFLPNTQAYSEYRLRDAIGDRALQLASGIRNNWDVAEGVRVTTGLEHLQVIAGATPEANAATIGVEYTANPLWKGSTRIEYRTSGATPGIAVSDAFNTTLWQGMVARKLSRDWTLLGRDYLLWTRYSSRGDVVQNRAQLGVAYRDTDTNRVNALAKIERKLESDDSNASVGLLRNDAWILSTHADYHPSRPWWLTGQVAIKIEHDVLEQGVRSDFKAALLAGRVVYDITENWDLGAMLAVQAGQYGARQKAYGLEVGYLLQKNLWLSAGINITGFSGDSDLTGYEYTNQGAYIRLRFKFDETLMRGSDPKVNSALAR